MNRSIAPLALLLLALSPAMASAATTRYVDDGGSDLGGANSCTAAANPCQTIGQAVLQAASGDTIVIAPGNYFGSATPGAKVLHFVGAGSGTATAADPGDTSIVGTVGSPAMAFAAGGSVRDVRLTGGFDPVGFGGPGLTVAATNAAAAVDVDRVVAVGGFGINGGGGGVAVLNAPNALDLDVARSTFVPSNGFFPAPAAVVDADVGSVSFSATSMLGSTAGSTATTGLEILGDAPVELDGSTVDGNPAVMVREGELSVSRSRLVGVSPGDGLTVLSQAGATPLATVRNSLVTASSTASTPAVLAAATVQNVGPGSAKLTAIRSTFVGTGTAVDAAIHVSRSAAGPATATLLGTVARLQGSTEAGAADVIADGGSLGAANSAFTTRRLVNGGSAPVPGAGSNLAGDPRFVSPSDFHLQASSPLVDRGSALLGVPGETDLDRRARSLDGNGDCVAVPDVGAYERPALACPPPPNVAPVLGASLSRKRFTSRKPKTRGRKRGTRFRIQLSEAAKVSIKVERKARGRRVSVKGKRRCVRPTRRNAAKPRCVRYVRAGSLTRQLAGDGQIGFAGRLRGRALPAGSYRATLVATDGAGLRSKPVRLRFRVLKP